MSPRVLFLLGTLTCVSVLVVASLGWNESDAPLGTVIGDSGAGFAAPAEGANHLGLVDPVVATANSIERVDVLEGQGQRRSSLSSQAGRWKVRFICTAIESLPRLEVAVDGPGMDFEGVDGLRCR